MSRHKRRPTLRPWVLVLAVLALIGGPMLLYKMLPVAGVSAAAAAGLVAIVAIKHLGVIAVLLGSVYALLRGRSGRGH